MVMGENSTKRLKPCQSRRGVTNLREIQTQMLAEQKPSEPFVKQEEDIDITFTNSVSNSEEDGQYEISIKQPAGPQQIEQIEQIPEIQNFIQEQKQAEKKYKVNIANTERPMVYKPSLKYAGLHHNYLG